MTPTVVVIDDPLPHRESGGSTVMEVLVISHNEGSGRVGQDPLQTPMRDLSTPIAADADAETLEACRISLVENAKKLATMRSERLNPRS